MSEPNTNVLNLIEFNVNAIEHNIGCLEKSNDYQETAAQNMLDAIQDFREDFNEERKAFWKHKE